MRIGIWLATAAAALFAVVLPASAESPPARVPVGDLLLRYDAARWRVETAAMAAEIHAVGAHASDPPVTIAIAPDTGACTPAAMLARASLFHDHAWEHDVDTIARPGFDLHVATVELGCRNWTGSPVFACLAHQGQAYTITANPGGCQHTPPRYDSIVLDMLMGLEVP
ncbi:MAG: hypothetical protein AB7I52_02335 [Rhizobiaceae bacterium]